MPDQRDTYPGVQVTIFDNRGICQHSGLCTDRAPTAFRTSTEPFVAPSGARLDELVRAVRDCPSGALSLAFDRRRQALRQRRGPRPGRLARHPGARDRGHPGRPLPGDRHDPADRRRRRRRAPRRGLLPGALRPLPLRPLAEQAVLQRHALVRGLPRPGPRHRRPDPVRVGRRPARADPDDPAALREARPRRHSARQHGPRAAVRHHGARCPAARGGRHRGSLRRAPGPRCAAAAAGVHGRTASPLGGARRQGGG